MREAGTDQPALDRAYRPVFEALARRDPTLAKALRDAVKPARAAYRDAVKAAQDAFRAAVTQALTNS